LRNDGFQIFAVELTPSAVDYKTLFHANYEKVCLIMGNEIA
jgi:tRNA G18 (ribose-2'-O)-methylase SpoU